MAYCRPSLVSADVFVPLPGVLPGLRLLQPVFPSNLHQLLEIFCGMLLLRLYSTLPLHLLPTTASSLPPSCIQPRAVAAPPERASSLPLLSSPTQRELTHIESFLPRSGSSVPQKELPPSLIESFLPRSGSSPRNSLLPPSIIQPRAAAAPPERAYSSLNQSISPAQRQLHQKQPPPSFNRSAPRSGSSARKIFLPPPIEQPRAAGAPPERASSIPLLSSRMQQGLYLLEGSSSLQPPTQRELVPHSETGSTLLQSSEGLLELHILNSGCTSVPHYHSTISHL